MQTSRRNLWLAVAAGFWLATQLPAFSLGGDLQGLHKNDSTNWSSASPWTGGNLQGWLELDYVVARAALSGEPRSNQTVTIIFPKFKTDAPGFQNVYFISNSPNLKFNSAPVLNAPPAPEDWSYTLNVTITNDQPGYIYYYARLAAGAHLNVGSSLHLGGEPALSPLQIHKPDAGPGSPDLAITKIGPANAGPGDIITYTITYTNKASGSNNTANGVQLSDRLPHLVEFVSASDGGTNEAGFLTWDLPDLTNRASGFVTYQVRVLDSVFNGQTFTNNAIILSSEDDANFLDNRAIVITTVRANRPPVATNDAYTINEDTVLEVSAPGILANDTDPEPGTTLSAVLETTTANGVLALNSNGSFTYTPSLNFNGTDTFTYRASDGSNFSAVATVTIVVNPTNDPPVAVNDAFSVLEDQMLLVNAPGILLNDSDVDGDALSAVLVTGVTNGTLSLNADGSFTYMPNPDYYGPDGFTYRANDGALDSGVATVAITVMPDVDEPVAVNDAYTTIEDATLVISVPGVLANDSDADGDALMAVLVNTVAHGTLALNANGSFSYTPSLNYTGVDTFTYRASDGGLSSPIATVTITVTPTNDAPVAVNDTHTIDEDTALTIAAPGVLGNDGDVDGDALTAVLVAQPTNGVLSLNADGSFAYRPNTNYHGLDAFTYRASDGRLESGIAVVTITVNPINDPPVAADDFYTTAEDTMLTITAPGVLGNDADVDGDPLAAVLVSNVSHGTLDLSANGAFTYTPSLNYTGTDVFVYRATDGLLSSNATVTIAIVPTNDFPVARDDSFSTLEDTTLTIPAAGVLANDSDVDGDALSAVLVNNVSHGTLDLSANGAFTYTPSLNYTGIDVFVYRATDGVLSSNATVTITVVPVNDPPVPGAAGDSYSVLEDGVLTIAAPGVLANDSDVDGDPLTSVLVATVAHGTLTLNPNGSFVYTPAANYFGPDSFVYVAHDGRTNSVEATVNITVIPVNDAPSFTGSGDQKVNENTGAQTVSWARNISKGPDNESEQSLNFLVSNDNNGLFAAQPAIAPDGTLTYTPATGEFGVANVSVRLRDSGGTENGGVDTSGEVTFRIVVNSPPHVAIVSPVEGNALLHPATFSVVASAGDPDGTVTNVQFFVNGSALTNVAEAPFYFVLSNVVTGSYQFLAVATDDCGLSATSAPVNMSVVTNVVPADGPATLNRQNGLFEHFVTVTNRSTETWLNGLRLFVTNLDPTNQVWNRTGTTNGVPYIDKTNAVPPGGTLQILVQYYVPNPRVVPNPTLVAIPKPFARPIVVPVITLITTEGGGISFTSQPERFYFIQFTEDFTTWKTDPEAMSGTGGLLISPQSRTAPMRFYRVLLIP